MRGHGFSPAHNSSPIDRQATERRRRRRRRRRRGAGVSTGKLTATVDSSDSALGPGSPGPLPCPPFCPLPYPLPCPPFCPLPYPLSCPLFCPLSCRLSFPVCRESGRPCRLPAGASWMQRRGRRDPHGAGGRRRKRMRGIPHPGPDCIREAQPRIRCPRRQSAVLGAGCRRRLGAAHAAPDKEKMHPPAWDTPACATAAASVYTRSRQGTGYGGGKCLYTEPTRRRRGREGERRQSVSGPCASVACGGAMRARQRGPSKSDGWRRMLVQQCRGRHPTR